MDRTPSRASHAPADFNRALRHEGQADAFESLMRAAEAGCLRAQFLVGLAYHTGRGVALDYKRAGAWYRLAACRGDSYAIANLGVMSLLGQGTPADELDAYTWIQSAVGLGHRALRPAMELLERRIGGEGDVQESGPILSAIAPEIPGLRPCTRPTCDYSLCDAS